MVMINTSFLSSKLDIPTKYIYICLVAEKERVGAMQHRRSARQINRIPHVFYILHDLYLDHLYTTTHSTFTLTYLHKHRLLFYIRCAHDRLKCVRCASNNKDGWRTGTRHTMRCFRAEGSHPHPTFYTYKSIFILPTKKWRYENYIRKAVGLRVYMLSRTYVCVWWVSS